MDKLKQLAYDHCEAFVASRTERLRAEMDKIKDSLQSETKSTAGDKHETGRAMLQLKREQLGTQLAGVSKLNVVLRRIQINTINGQVALGSLVRTDRAAYFMGISAGSFTHAGQTIFCVSLATPIGKELLGKKKGDAIMFNGQELRILEIG